MADVTTEHVAAKEGVITEYRGEHVSYIEYYYLDYHVDEQTGKIDRKKTVEYSTQQQVSRSFVNLHKAYTEAIKANNEAVDN